MSTRVRTSATLSAACHKQLRKKLSLPLDPFAEVRRINAFLDAERIDVHAIREMIGSENTRSVLGTLAPSAFGRVCGLLAEAADLVLDQRALSAAAQAALSEAVAVADAKITTAARGIIAGAFARAAAELKYKVSVRQKTTATEMELRRGDEVIHLKFKDGTEAGPWCCGSLGVMCGPWQPDLEQAVERLGVILAKPRHCYHEEGHLSPAVFAVARAWPEHQFGP